MVIRTVIIEKLGQGNFNHLISISELSVCNAKLLQNFLLSQFFHFKLKATLTRA
jgi:hypothetical protein